VFVDRESVREREREIPIYREERCIRMSVCMCVFVCLCVCVCVRERERDIV
jgi:hypothetical protein